MRGLGLSGGTGEGARVRSWASRCVDAVGGKLPTASRPSARPLVHRAPCLLALVRGVPVADVHSVTAARRQGPARPRFVLSGGLRGRRRADGDGVSHRGTAQDSAGAAEPAAEQDGQPGMCQKTVHLRPGDRVGHRVNADRSQFGYGALNIANTRLDDLRRPAPLPSWPKYAVRPRKPRDVGDLVGAGKASRNGWREPTTRLLTNGFRGYGPRAHRLHLTDARSRTNRPGGDYVRHPGLHAVP